MFNICSQESEITLEFVNHKMSKPKIFILNDDAVQNSYGFYILTSGGKLDRFKSNPVMLSDHVNKNENVIGNWLNLEVVNGLIQAEPNFDVARPLGLEISGQVARGFIKGASMGIVPNWDSMERVGDKLILKEWELVEASIVPVPSNKNSIAVYGIDGELMNEVDITKLCLSIQSEKKPQLNLKKVKMQKTILSIAALMALGFKDSPTDGHDASDVESKILDLSVANATLKTENETLKLAAQTAKDLADVATKKAINDKVDLAVTQGKINPTQKEEFVNLGLANASVLDTALNAIAPKKNFSVGIEKITKNVSAVASLEDFQKLPIEAQLSFKNDSPDEYKKLFS